MKKASRKILTTSILVLLICVLPDLASAQPNPDGDPDTGIPIDGGISMLAVAGIAYGIKKKYDLTKSKA